MTASPSNEPIAFNHILGQGRVNQLGGLFINGRPLPQHIRLKIIEMASNGVKPCQISRQLRVSHGAVSKILNRFQETGSISPGQIGGNPRQRLAVQTLEKQLQIAFEENDQLGPSELRQVLIDQDICSRATAPTVASIARFIRSKGWSRREKRPQEQKRHSYSIESLLGISMDDSKSSSSDDDSSSPESRRNRTSFSTEQLEALENAFKANTYPDASEREIIARNTGLTEEKIMTWFSNRRARCRKHLPAYPPVFPNMMHQSTNSAFAPLPLFIPGLPMMFSQFMKPESNYSNFEKTREVQRELAALH